MRETGAVPTPHKSPVCCPIWLAGFPPRRVLLPGELGLQKCALASKGRVSPGLACCPRPGGLPPPLLQRFPPRALTLVLTFPTWTPFLLPSSSLLLCLMPEASPGDLSGGPWAPPATRKRTAKGKPTPRPLLPLEGLLWSLLPGSSSKCKSGRKVRLSLLPLEDDFCLRLEVSRFGRKRHPVKFEGQINNKYLVRVRMSQTLHGTYLPWAPCTVPAALTQSFPSSATASRCAGAGALRGPLLESACSHLYSLGRQGHVTSKARVPAQAPLGIEFLSPALKFKIHT